MSHPISTLLLVAALSSCGPAGRPVSISDANRLSPDDGAMNHHFGSSVALGDTRIIVGAPGASDQGLRSGAVYVYRKRNAAWTQEEKLTPAAGGAENRFGRSVALLDDLAAVASRGRMANGRHSGAVTLFQESDGGFLQIKSFTSTQNHDSFGASLVLSTERLVVGAPGDTRHGIDAGAAHIYRRSDEGWLSETRLDPHRPAPRVRFGAAVAIHSNRIAVGAPGDPVKGPGAGAVHLFRITSSGPVSEAVFRSPHPSPDDSYGASIALSADRLVVGAPMEDGWLRDTGAVYVYVRRSEKWTLEAQLDSGALEGGLFFGCSVALDGNLLLVGARGHDGHGWESGSAHLFKRAGSKWVAEVFLAPKSGGRNGFFGHAGALHGRQGVVGAYGAKVLGPWSGAAFFF